MAIQSARLGTERRLFRDWRDPVACWRVGCWSAAAGMMRWCWRRPAAVPVDYEIAAAVGAPLDVFAVRELGVPGARSCDGRDVLR
jgi:hypothetical protein